MKKIIAIYMIMLLLLLSSCKSTSKISRIDETTEVDSTYNSFIVKSIELSDEIISMGGKPYIRSVTKCGDKFIVLVKVYLNDVIRYAVMSTDMDWNSVATTEINMYNESTNEKFISDCAIDENNNIYTVETDNNGRYTYIIKYAPNGELIYCNEFKHLATVLAIQPMTDGSLNVVLFRNTKDILYKFSESGEIVYEKESKLERNYMPEYFLDDEILTAVYQDTFNNIYYVGIMQPDETEYIVSPVQTSDEVTKITFGSGYDLYYKNEYGLFGYNFGDSSGVMLIDWLETGISSSEIRKMTVVDENHFVFEIIDNVTYYKSLIDVSRDYGASPAIEKDEIKLACMKGNPITNSLLSNFNRQSDKYKITAVYYSDNNDGISASDRLSLDMAAGYMPDIIMSYESGIDLANLASKNALCDLYEFIDSDPTISRDNLLPCVRTPFETDGHLYSIATNFSLHTLTAKSLNLNGMTGWNLPQILEYEAVLPEGVSLYYSKNRTLVSSILLQYGMSEFVDDKNMTCSFNRNEFISLIEYLKTLNQNVNDISGWQSMLKRYSDNKIILYNNGDINNFLLYGDMVTRMGGEEITMIGYPVPDGCGTYIKPQFEYAITNTSENKEGAWEFISYMLRDENLFIENNDFLYFPATLSALNKAFDSVYKFIFVLDRTDGGMKMILDIDFDTSDENYITYKFTKSDADKLLDVMNRINRIYGRGSLNEIIRGIVGDELNAFYNSVKTAKETARIIQNRVSTYLSEIS